MNGVVGWELRRNPDPYVRGHASRLGLAGRGSASGGLLPGLPPVVFGEKTKFRPTATDFIPLALWWGLRGSGSRPNDREIWHPFEDAVGRAVTVLAPAGLRRAEPAAGRLRVRQEPRVAKPRLFWNPGWRVAFGALLG